MRDLRRENDPPTGTPGTAIKVLAMAGMTLASAVLFCVCAFQLEAWGPPPLLLGAGVGLVGVLVGGVVTLGTLLGLIARHVEVEEETPVMLPRLFRDRLGLPIPETPDTGG